VAGFYAATQPQNAAAVEIPRQRRRAARQGTVIASGADGVPGLAQALLGATLLARGYFSTTSGNIHGRCHISVSSGARTYRRQPVVIRFFSQ